MKKKILIFGKNSFIGSNLYTFLKNKHFVKITSFNSKSLINLNEFDYIKQNKNSSIDLISYVDDRLGHDYRYAIDISKIKNELGWYPKTNINKGLKNTLNWYLND